jgi:predicted N-acyltransferase
VEITTYCPLQEEIATIKDYSLSICSSVNQLKAVEWNRLIPRSNFLMQHNYLQLIEDIQAGQMQFRYVLVSRNGATIGALYFQVVQFKGAQLINYFPDKNSSINKVLRSMSIGLLNNINPYILVSGNVFMTGENGFYFTSDIDKPTRAKLLRKAIRDIFRTDTFIKAVAISDFYAPKTEFDNGFAINGYHQVAAESDMSIQLRDEWKSMNDYQSALSSKYRVRAKKVFALCAENNVVMRELNANEIAEHEDEIYDLYMKVMAKVDFKLAELSKSYFRLQKEQLPDNYKLFAYYKDGQMIGFISAFHIGKRIEVHYTGMNHDLCKPIHLYQHMMYDLIEYGILNRAEKLHFGRTAPEIKSTIGAVPSPMYGYIKHRNPVFNALLVKTYTSNLKPQQYELRSPFKY